jgi:predicted DNA-binding transcriptional regulator YafY
MVDSSQNRRCSQAELEQLFTEHKMEELLPLCTRHTICDEEYSPTDSTKPFTKRRGFRYVDATTGDEVAITFHYTHRDGTRKRVINRLVINGNRHDALLS